MWRGMSCRLHLHSLRGTIIRFALLLSAFLYITQAGYAVDVSFDKDVLPIMQAKCFRCHNQQRAEGSLRLDLKASVLQGGDSGPALIPSNAEDSLILHRIQASSAVGTAALFKFCITHVWRVTDNQVILFVPNRL